VIQVQQSYDKEQMDYYNASLNKDKKLALLAQWPVAVGSGAAAVPTSKQ